MKKLFLILLALPLSVMAAGHTFNATVISLTTQGSPTNSTMAVSPLPVWPADVTCRDSLAVLSTEHSLLGAARDSLYAQHEVRIVVEDTTPDTVDRCFVRQIRARALNLP